MIYFTGDTHADFRRFNMDNFPEQKEMSREDYVLIAGDFGGIWAAAEPFPLIEERKRKKALKNERNVLQWFAGKNPTFCFVLGNHENYNRYDSGEFPVVDFHGGKAQKLAENVFHLMSGYVFELCGRSLFTFDGAASHDITDGVLDLADFDSVEDFKEANRRMLRGRKLYRVKDYEWWERESRPTEEEKERGRENLLKHGNRVNYVLTHCLPQSVASFISDGLYKPNDVTKYLDEINERIQFDHWICGHYHENRTILDKYHIIYEQLVRAV